MADWRHTFPTPGEIHQLYDELTRTVRTSPQGLRARLARNPLTDTDCNGTTLLSLLTTRYIRSPHPTHTTAPAEGPPLG